MVTVLSLPWPGPAYPAPLHPSPSGEAGQPGDAGTRRGIHRVRAHELLDPNLVDVLAVSDRFLARAVGSEFLLGRTVLASAAAVYVEGESE
jgi:hypothetical protein